MDTTPKPSLFLGRRFWIGFVVGFSLFVPLNVADYFFYTVPADPKLGLPVAHKVGAPWTFWVAGRPYLDEQRVIQPGFYWGSLLADVALAFSLGIGCGIEFQRRRKSSDTPAG
jgi:hypothetical protein